VKVLIGSTLLICLSSSLSTFAAGKCVKRKDINKNYSSSMRFIENFGHVLAINTSKYDLETGHTMDIYVQKIVPVEDKKTKQITHYKKCLALIKKQIQGKYIYGSFT
jgi:hypothetical protein